jgi:uncharacterized protein (DUF305 family)
METHEIHKIHSEKSHYGKLVVMIVFSFIAMYGLMYSMVDGFANVIHNINQVYMATLMTAAMIILEIIIMKGMYHDKRKNTIILLIGAALLILSYLGIRKQTAVGDQEFIKSMIPHHAAAILMVRETELQDPELQKLASDIITAQQKEIDFMKAKLKELQGN